jgi:hypothetical protein
MKTIVFPLILIVSSVLLTAGCSKEAVKNESPKVSISVPSKKTIVVEGITYTLSRPGYTNQDGIVGLDLYEKEGDSEHLFTLSVDKSYMIQFKNQ